MPKILLYIFNHSSYIPKHIFWRESLIYRKMSWTQTTSFIQNQWYQYFTTIFIDDYTKLRYYMVYGHITQKIQEISATPFASFLLSLYIEVSMYNHAFTNFFKLFFLQFRTLFKSIFILLSRKTSFKNILFIYIPLSTFIVLT